MVVLSSSSTPASPRPLRKRLSWALSQGNRASKYAWPLKNWEHTSWAQRSMTPLSLRPYACLRCSSATIRRMGNRGRPAGLTPAPASATVGPKRSMPPTQRPARSRCANRGAKLDSICAHGMRDSKAARGCRRSIIESSRARKESKVAIRIKVLETL